MACTPFLQRIGLVPIRTRQNFVIDVPHSHAAQQHITFPSVRLDLAPINHVIEPMRGTTGLYPYTDGELRRNTNDKF